MEDEVLFLRLLLLFHLRLIEECAIEVLASGSRRKPWCLFECPREVAPGFRCDARVFHHLGMQNPVCHETLHGVEAKVKHRLVPAHGFGLELHGLLFDAVFQRLLDRDVCWLQLRCVATRDEEHVALRMSSTDPFQQGSLSMDRGTIPQQHPIQEPLFSHSSAKPLDQLLACAPGAPVALAEGVGNVLVLRLVLHHTFRGALHDELGHDGACHGHDRRDREISLVSGADDAHPSVLLRCRPAAVPQLRGRLVHVDDARHVIHQAQSELVHVRVHQFGVRRLLGPA